MSTVQDRAVLVEHIGRGRLKCQADHRVKPVRPCEIEAVARVKTCKGMSLACRSAVEFVERAHAECREITPITCGHCGISILWCWEVVPL